MDGTGSSTFFEESALAIAKRVEGDDSKAAREIAREALELAEVFRSWAATRPDGKDRVARIEALFALNRRVLEYTQRRASPHH